MEGLWWPLVSGRSERHRAENDEYREIEIRIMLRNANATAVSVHDAWRRQ